MKATEQEFQQARKTHALATIRHADYSLTADPDHGDEDAAELCAEAIRQLVPLGLYEHWKSKEGDAKFYLVSDVTLEVDVHYPSVTYKSLYGKRAGKPAGRHLIHMEGTKLSKKDRGFLTPIDRLDDRKNPYRGPRFRLVRKLTLRQIVTLVEQVDVLKMITDPTRLRQAVDKILAK